MGPRHDPVYLLRMGVVGYRQALRLMQRLAEARRRDDVGDCLLLVQHPNVVTLGRGGGIEDLRVPRDRLRVLGVEVVETERGGRATCHTPGQLVAYPILRLPNRDLHGYLWRLEQVVLDLLEGWGIVAQRVERYPGVWVGREKIAAVGIAVRDRVTTHGVALNVDPDMAAFGTIVPCGLADRGVTSMRAILGRRIGIEEVEDAFVGAFARIFGRKVEPRRTPGPWLMAMAAQEATAPVEAVVAGLGLHTVCEEAACPNLGECWSRGTATFLVLGDVCTRHCRFCNVRAGWPGPPDPEEPSRVAEAAARLGLRHVVVTSVARDDLPDGGAGLFAATIRAIRRRLPEAIVEVLVPDFGGSQSALESVADARPDVFNHNLETVERLSGSVRARASYRRSLGVLAWARRRGLKTKSGLMVGLGERCGEVVDAMRDLRRVGCDLLTIGQYLQPSPRQQEVVDYIHPAVFDWYREVALAMGFQGVASSPLVRSSYRAEEVWAKCS
ncbi:MAG: lipoyl synthase [Sphingomonadaceae bacterium]